MNWKVVEGFMSRTQVSYQIVAKAAEKIKKTGKAPSLTDVSKALGLLEEPPELSSLLEEWYHNQPEFKRSGQQPLTNNIHIDSSHIVEKNIELEKSLSLVRATLESTADGIMMVNGKGQVVDWNQKFIDMWRIPSHMMEVGTERISFDYILSQLQDPSSLISDVQYLYENPEWQGELPELHFKDGRVFERYTQPQRIGNQIVGRVYSFRDVTEKRRSEDFLRIRERAIEASSHGVAIIDVESEPNSIIYVNKAFQRITGYREKEALGKSLKNLQGFSPTDANYKRMSLAIREDRDEVLEIECRHKNGAKYWSEISLSPVHDSTNKKDRHFVCILNDITDRRELEQQLLQQATHDSLTELPNRVLLIDRIEQAILQAKKQKSILAFMFIDLDKFKMTNDTLGHGIGDKLIQLIANRLLIATDEFDTVARLGGDEFFILLTSISTEEEAKEKAKEILKSIQLPVQIDQHNITITASIGICYYPKDGADFETLMKNADLSMYHAKDSGRNMFKVFEPDMNNRLINVMQLDNALRDALKNNEFTLVYQPLIDIINQKIMGVEALIRWRSKILGPVSPMDFIGVAEENGLIIDIGKWVLETACKQLKELHKLGMKDLIMAVNISERQFKQSNLISIVDEALEKAKLDSRYLELELTESLLIENVNSIVSIMTSLKERGVGLSIDDFGTGYSSLSYLKRFPVDKLKVDRSFINDMVNDKNDAAIAKAVVNLGHSLSLTVLAEGIETKTQLDLVREFSCDYAQGYYFSKPLPAEELIDYMISFPNCHDDD